MDWSIKGKSNEQIRIQANDHLMRHKGFLLFTADEKGDPHAVILTDKLNNLEIRGLLTSAQSIIEGEQAARAAELLNSEETATGNEDDRDSGPDLDNNLKS